MIDLQARQMSDDFARRIMQQGMSLEQYFQFTGLNEEKMMEEFRPQAEKRIRTRLVLEAVVLQRTLKCQMNVWKRNFRRWQMLIRWKLTSSKNLWATMRRNR